MAQQRHPLFTKYTRTWLHEKTGYTKAYLCRMATGNASLTRSFIERVCFKLKQPAEELFLLEDGQLCECHRPGGCSEGSLGQWLAQKCKEEHLESLRHAATATGLTHTTISAILSGSHPSPETIRKLVQAFSNGPQEHLVLEDELLELAGYRTPRPEEKPNQLLARLLDKVEHFNDRQLTVMGRFADFLTEIEGKGKEEVALGG